MIIMRRTSKAFTLVELLVVIGIIALLVGILLPVLGQVRKQANATKCATALREIGNAMQLYAMDNRGFLPCTGADGRRSVLQRRWRQLSQRRRGTSGSPFWRNMRRKTRSARPRPTAGRPPTRKTILWGCPEWQGYYTGTIGEYNRVQVGLGMNDYPTFAENSPAAGSFPPRSGEQLHPELATGNPQSQLGNWQKLITYGRNGSRRCLVADSQYWLSEAEAPPASGVLPGQKLFDPGPVTYSLTGQTMIDVYRHGKYPKVKVPGASGYYDTNGGKVAFNVLYCDGHVTTELDRKLAYKVLRMKFPG